MESTAFSFPSRVPFGAGYTCAIFLHILTLTWTCISACVFRHVAFKQHIPRMDSLLRLGLQVAPSFAPGLLEVLNAATPPTLEFFKGTPAVPATAPKLFGVYVLVYEKPGSLPRVYIGSGTADRGVQERLASYLRGVNMTTPNSVIKARNEGFELVHQGLLAWSRMPTPADKVLFRLFFLALEAMFTFGFWTFAGSKDRCMPEARI